MEAVVCFSSCVWNIRALVSSSHIRDAIASMRILKDKWIEVAFSSELVVLVCLFQKE